MIRNCRLWLLGALVLVFAAVTTLLMAAQAEHRGEADSLVGALLQPPPTARALRPWQPAPPREAAGAGTSAPLAASTGGLPAADRPESAR